MLYNKKPHTIKEQITKLKDRGLVIDCEEQIVIKYLENISYYRLAGYWWSMQDDKEKHTFKANSAFSNVINLYNFDTELRFLIFKVVEKIEISLRTKLIYHLSLKYGAWWFQDTNLFDDIPAATVTLAKLSEELVRSKDTFVKEHRKKYKNDKRFPPAWKTLELTSLGTLSKIYGNLKNNIDCKDDIAVEYGAVNHTYLPSWLQSIAQIRNICAHHGRLWNKNLPGTVKLLKKPPNKWIVDVPKEHEFQKLYIHLCLMKYLLDTIDPKNSFAKELKALVNKYPNIDPVALGMKQAWQNEFLWN